MISYVTFTNNWGKGTVEKAKKVFDQIRELFKNHHDVLSSSTNPKDVERVREAVKILNRKMAVEHTKS